MSSLVDSMAATYPNAAPLEQNIKCLECDGIPYRVIKDENKPYGYVSQH